MENRNIHRELAALLIELLEQLPLEAALLDAGQSGPVVVNRSLRARLALRDETVRVKLALPADKNYRDRPGDSLFANVTFFIASEGTGADAREPKGKPGGWAFIADMAVVPLLREMDSLLLAAPGEGSHHHLRAVAVAALVAFLQSAPTEQEAAWARAQLDAMPGALVWRNENLTISGCNRAFEALVRMSEQELAGKTSACLPFISVTAGRQAEELRARREGVPVFDTVSCIRRINEPTVWLRGSIIPALREAGRFRRYVTLHEDIGEALRLRQCQLMQNLEANRVHRGILNMSQVIVFSCWPDEEYRIDYMSENVTFLGYESLEFLTANHTVRDLLHLEEWPAFFQMVESQRPAMGSVTRFQRIMHKDGRSIHMQLSAHFVATTDGLRLEGTLVDVTRQAELRQALSARQKPRQERIDELFTKLQVPTEENQKPLWELIDQRLLQKQQEALSRMFGIGSILIDEMGSNLTHYTGGCAACVRIKGCTDGARLCGEQYEDLSLRTSMVGKSGMKTCDYTGMTIASVPIRVGQRMAAGWVVEQARIRELNRPVLSGMLNTLDLDVEECFAELEAVPYMAMADFNLALKVWELFATELSMGAVRVCQKFDVDNLYSQVSRKGRQGKLQNVLLADLFTLLRSDGAAALDISAQMLKKLASDQMYSRAYLYRVEQDGCFRRVYEWHGTSGVPQPESFAMLPAAAVAGLSPEQNGRLLVFEGFRGDEAGYLAQYAKEAGARSVVWMPVFSGRRLCALIGMDECVRLRVIFPQDKIFFEMVLRMIGVTLIRDAEGIRAGAASDALLHVARTAGRLLCLYNPETRKKISFHKTAGELTDLFLKETDLAPSGEERAETGTLAWEGRLYQYTEKKAPWLDGCPARMLLFADRTEKEERKREFRRVAGQDSFLPVGSRVRFLQDLGDALREAESTGVGGMLVSIGMDGLGDVNVRDGFEAGDQLLLAAAEYLQNEFCYKGRAYRAGDDAFALILPKDDDPEAVLRELLARFREPWALEDESMRSCTASMGAVFFPEGDAEAGEIARRAEVARSAVKKSGKDNFVFYEEAQEGAIRARRQTNQMLRASVEDNCSAFGLMYQPIAELRTGRWTGVEALLRWRGESAEMAPAAFLELAESLGLMHTIGLWTIRSAIRAIRPLGEDLFVECNFTLRQLQTESLAADIAALLKEENFPAERLVADVKESVLSRGMARMEENLQRLRTVGVRVCVDDVGVSGFAYAELPRYPVDALKLDRGFVSGVGEDAFNSAYARCVAKLCKAADMTARAQGVETEAQKIWLTENGFYDAAGYLFARPMERQDLERIRRENA